MKWRKFNGETINLPIYDAVENVIKRETAAGYHLKVCIGTDSQVKGQETEFATVIVFLREGHADINTNPHFKSNDALKEAMGYILGMGFAFKAKPEAFASSSCANKVVN